jgi:hypothetical protein
METGYQLLINKLDEFIRKFYKNQMIRGVIYSLAILLGFYILLVLLEYFGRFNSTVRTIFFFLFILSAGAVIFRFIAWPMLKLFRLGETISHEQASRIIGTHFTEIRDKLLNTLQLKEQAAMNPGRAELIEAGINQKIDDLKPVPFTSAIDFGQNKKYLKFAIIPASLIIVLLFARPTILTESTGRLVKFNEEIVPEAPYNISLLNDNLDVPENDDFQLQVELSGNEIPEKMYIEMNGSRFKFERKDNITFSHTFKNVQEDIPFQLYGGGFYSEEFTLNTLPTPLLLNFKVDLDYPAYTQKKDEVLNNTGDLTIPEGTKVVWKFKTKNTDQFSIAFPDTTVQLESDRPEEYFYESAFTNSQDYSLHSSNEFLKNRDSIVYQLNVIPDAYPQIAVEEKRDTTSRKHMYFTGQVKDDYGFRSLSFNYFKINEKGEKVGEPQSVRLDVKGDVLAHQFFYHWDLEGVDLQTGDKLNYYFEVRDNDGVNGSKASRTTTKSFNVPTEEELDREEEQENEKLKDDLEKNIKEAQDIQKKLDEARKEMFQKKELSWQDKQKIDDLLKRQKNLQKNVENIQKQNQQNNKKNSEFQKQSESIKEKQQQLQKLFDELMTDEMKKMYEELEKLMEEMDKEELQKQMEEMNMTNEDVEKELDRALEQFKQLEWEQKMKETIEELNELGEKQKELAEKSKDKNQDSEELKKEQEKIKEEFEKVKEDMKKLEEMNEELENPNETPDTEEDQKEVEEEMEKSSEELEKNNKNKASESQESAGEKMQEMSQKMDMMMQQQQAESMQEDMDALRDLLENIIQLSFDQEDLMDDLKAIDADDPKYVKYGQQQRKLKDDAKMVEDSLFALSKRVTQIQSIVNREINQVNENMKKALAEIGERRTPEATTHQQYVMTSFNNLALLLDEALQQMQMQMANKQPGKGNCEKPGGSGKKPSAGDIKKMQEALSKQLQQMKEQMGKGKKGKKGESKPGSQGMSKEIAQMAAKQAAIRKEIEKMAQELNEDGSGKGNGLKEIAKDMEEQEKDMVNKKFDTEIMNRQQEIISRLLKAENAEREREMDEKRKSLTGDQSLKSNPLDYLEYQKQQQKEVELLKTMPPSLKPYYKERVNEYFNKLEAE